MSFAVFDGHNDVLARLWLSDRTDCLATAFLNQTLSGQMDFLRCQQAGMIGGIFALFIPPFSYVLEHAPHKISVQSHQQKQYTHADLIDICTQQLAYALEIESKSQGKVKICVNAYDLDYCLKHQIFALVLHLEGADVLDEKLSVLDNLYESGLRSIGPLWNTPNQFGHGLQAKFPHSPNTGLGLTEQGKTLIRICQQKNMVVDVSHMNEHAFWDTAEILSQPIVATHSNVHRLCPQARNLLDSQLTAIQKSDGFVGLNFDTAFLRSDGKRNAYTSFDIMFAHLDHLLAWVGEDNVGFGSDYDGGFMSNLWSDVSKMPDLLDALSDHGYSDRLIHQLSHENWLNLLKRVWK